MEKVKTISAKPSDFESRIIFLATRAARMQMSISDEVIEFIAAKSCSHHAMEGVLIFLNAHQRLSDTLITPEIAAKLLESTSIDFESTKTGVH